MRRDLVRRSILHTGGAVATLVVAYAIIPVRSGSATATAIVTLVLGIAAFVWVFRREARRIGRSPSPTLAAFEALVVVVTIFVLSFALVYVALSTSDSGSFTDGVNKIAGVYLSMTVLTTVGFGDIAAVTDTARVVVTLQMICDVALLATAGRVVMLLARQAAADGSAQPPPGWGLMIMLNIRRIVRSTSEQEY